MERDGPAGEIGLSDTVKTVWSTLGLPLDGSIVFYADRDDAFNGNEIVIRESSLAAGAPSAWNWCAYEVGFGAYTFGTVVYASDGALLAEERDEETVAIVDSASTYIVNSLADTIVEDGLITLREAIQAVNTRAAAGDAPAPAIGEDGSMPVIRFDESTWGGCVALSGTQLEITRAGRHSGPGSGVDRHRRAMRQPRL